MKIYNNSFITCLFCIPFLLNTGCLGQVNPCYYPELKKSRNHYLYEGKPMNEAAMQTDEPVVLWFHIPCTYFLCLS
jgi:hypothetical protein